MNIYGFFADIIVAVHVTYLAAVIFGLLFIFIGRFRRWQWVKNFWFRFVHLSLIAIVVIEALLGIVCPLTIWEYQLRVAAGQNAEGGSFVGRLLHNLIFVDAPPELLTVCYCLFGALVLFSFWLVPVNSPKIFAETITPAEDRRCSLQTAVLTLCGSAAILASTGLFWNLPLREFNVVVLSDFTSRLALLLIFLALQCGLVILRSFPPYRSLAAVRGITKIFFIAVFLGQTLFCPMNDGFNGADIIFIPILVMAIYFFTPLLNIGFYLGIRFKQRPELLLYVISQTLLIAASILYHLTAGVIAASYSY